MQIDVERLVSDPHSAATQLDRFAIGIQDQFIVLESPNLRPVSLLSDVGRATSWTGSPIAASSPPKALRRIQTGQNCLSAVAKNFVPQTGQVRASCSTDPSWPSGSLTGFSDSPFTALALRQRSAHRRARESRSQSPQDQRRCGRPPRARRPGICFVGGG